VPGDCIAILSENHPGWVCRHGDSHRACGHGADLSDQLPGAGRIIVARKQELTVTADGKNIAPQPLEIELKLDKFNFRHLFSATSAPDWCRISGA